MHIQTKVKCILETIPQQGKRRKKSTSVTENSTSETKNGCPKAFQRVSHNLCLQYRVDSDGQGVLSSFNAPKDYCEKSIVKQVYCKW